jgi:hypothetical protein
MFRPARTAATLTALAALAAASPAAGAPTTRQTESVPYEFAVDCGTFEIGVRGVESLATQTFFDANGDATRVVTHDAFRETDTNSVSGAVVRFTGSRVETLDLAAGTRTLAGKEAQMTIPGQGDVIHDAGRVVFDAPFHVTFESGRHEVLHGDADALACDALAGA